MISRRKFIQSLSFFSFIPRFGLSQKAFAKDFENDSIRVLQSATLDTSTLITVLAHHSSQLEFNVRSFQHIQDPIFNVRKIDMKLGEFIVYQIHVTRLETQARYRLDIIDKTNDQIIVKNFKSLDLLNKNIKIAFMTCSSHRNAEPQKVMFDKIKNNQPDVIFFPGDLIYANSVLDTALGRPATPQSAYANYCKTFFELDFYSSDDLIPVFSSWDDHDLAFNNSDSTHPNLDIMYKMFRTFYPVDSRVEGITSGPGVSFCFEAFGAQFLFLDVRYFFNKKKKFILGLDQYNWLVNNCSKSDSSKFLISAVQFWNYGKLAECFEKEGSSEFPYLLSFLKSLPNPVIFLSGDVHYSQIQTVTQNILDYPTYEISSSALFSLSSRGYGRRSSDRGQLKYYGYPNFLIFENLLVNSNNINLTIRCVSEKSNAEFEMELKISK